MDSGWDILRFVVIALWGIQLGITVRVLLNYYGFWRKVETGSPNRHAGLLPLHVWTIALSYLIIGGSAAWHNVERLGEKVNALLFVNLVGFSLGVFALWLIMAFQHRRLSYRTVVENKNTPKRRWYDFPDPCDKDEAG